MDDISKIYSVCRVRRYIQEEMSVEGFDVWEQVKVSHLPEFDVLIDCRSETERVLMENTFFEFPAKIGFGITTYEAPKVEPEKL